MWRKILAHGLKRLATPALHLWRIRHGLVEELALCIKSLATPGIDRSRHFATYKITFFTFKVFEIFFYLFEVSTHHYNQIQVLFVLFLIIGVAKGGAKGAIDPLNFKSNYKTVSKK